MVQYYFLSNACHILALLHTERTIFHSSTGIWNSRYIFLILIYFFMTEPVNLKETKQFTIRMFIIQCNDLYAGRWMNSVKLFAWRHLFEIMNCALCVIHYNMSSRHLRTVATLIIILYFTEFFIHVVYRYIWPSLWRFLPTIGNCFPVRLIFWSNFRKDLVRFWKLITTMEQRKVILF